MAFVAWKLHPGLLITPTITTGGDTASHYYTAWWLRHELLPAGRISGWVPGNYAGFPLFQVYFPLPFVLMAVLSLATGLPAAFKLVTVAGLIGLPLAAYACFRLLGFVFPAPALAAVFTLPFLFHEADSMWGANVGSTLAGEITYSFGTALLLVFAGTLYRGATSGRWWVGNAALLAAVGLSHAYTLLVAAALGAYLTLFHPVGRRALPYLLKVAALAFGLMGFWAVPLLAYSGYTTAYSIVWPIRGFSHVFPPILWPSVAILAGGAAAVGFARWRSAAGGRAGETTPSRPSSRLQRQAVGAHEPDHRVGYLASLVAGALLLYLVSWKLDVVDIRFLPFVQLTVALLAALPAAAAIRRLADRLGRNRRPAERAKAVTAAALVLGAAALVWVDSRIEFVDDWAAWNYGGFEATPGWPGYRAVNDAVRRTIADPRVAYEHTTEHNDVGTIRAFESLPLFSGASTLEGLYMQSTISSPFVFYIQSEISWIPSCPLLPYHCARLAPARAAEHLRLYNVSEVIARGDRVTEALDNSPDFTLAAEAPPYRVFHVEGTDGAYVVPLRYEPLVLDSEDWRADFFAWFKRPGSGEVPLLRADVATAISGTVGPGAVAAGEIAAASWQRITALPERIPRRPLHGSVEVTSELASEEIRIRTSKPGHPLLVKVSYHPRWHVEGAEAVLLASPSFMLVIPTQEEVRLFYGAAVADRLGIALTALALLWVLGSSLMASAARRSGARIRDDSAKPEALRGGHTNGADSGVPSTGSGPWLLDRIFAYRGLWAPALVGAMVLSAVAVRLAYTDPWIPHREGLDLFHAEEYEAAEPLLLRSMAASPSSAAAYYSDYYYALIAFRTQQWERTVRRFEDFLRVYPDGELVPEAHFRVAEALDAVGRPDDAAARFLLILDEVPASRWAGFASERLAAAAAGR